MANESTEPGREAGSGSGVAGATPPAEGSMGMNALAGFSLGTLVGVLIGLSSVPVVASVVAALLALLVTFFGFARPEGTMATRTSGARFAGFGLAMALALAGGIALRAHGTLGPSFADRVARFTVAGLPQQQALELATYEHLGFQLGQLAKVEAPKALPASSPFAFSNTGDPACAVLDADHYSNAENRRKAMEQRGEPWATIARLSVNLPADQAVELANAAFTLRCQLPR